MYHTKEYKKNSFKEVWLIWEIVVTVRSYGSSFYSYYYSVAVTTIEVVAVTQLHILILDVVVNYLILFRKGGVFYARK